jgi:cell division protein FtsI/penicillin-binding protein 2
MRSRFKFHASMAHAFPFVLMFFVLTFTTLAQNSPQGIVEMFLQRWAVNDYTGMYQLIYVHRINNQPEYPEQVFIQRYEQVQTVLNITNLRYQINETTQQGQSATVVYDLVLESETYGDIYDADRLIRLININGTWQIAWSTHDIFAGLTNTGEVRVQAQSSRRGTIYDRNGQVIAQDGGRTYGVRTARQNMSNERECASLIADITLDPITMVEARWANLNPETDFFLAEIASELFQPNLSQLRSICGVQNEGFTSQPHRTYYGGSAFAHVLGYVSPVQDSNEEARYGTGQLVGRTGVEEFFNTQLTGRQDRAVRIIGPNGTVMRELATASGDPPMPIQTTLDRDLQIIVANAMSDAYNYGITNWGAPGISTGGAAVVLDPRNGDILALFSYPTFNTSLFNPDSRLSVMFGTDGRETADAARLAVFNSTRRPMANRATAEQYATGSTMKLVTAAAALNEGIYAPDELFDCQFLWDGSDRGDTASPRRDWRYVTEGFEPTGLVTPAQALMASCNPFFYEMGLRLYREVGPSAIADYSERLGMLRTYLGGMLREASGVVPVARDVTDAVNIAIGQGNVALTPLQMAVMTSGLANDGVIYRPRLVLQVGGYDGVALQERYEPEILQEMDLQDFVLDTIQEGMCGVTTNSQLGTAWGRFVREDGHPRSYSTILTAPYTSCGKTGTAEANGNPYAWYVAYAPADNPEVAVVVMVEQSLEGSQVSAPIVRRILDDYFGVDREPYPRWWNETTYLPLSSQFATGE